MKTNNTTVNVLTRKNQNDQFIPVKKARITYRVSGENKFHYIDYVDEVDLLQRVFNFEIMQKYHVSVFLVTDIVNKIRLDWNCYLAHCCFAKGRINENELYTMLLQQC
jgi:hypothetical protein